MESAHIHLEPVEGDQIIVRGFVTCGYLQRTANGIGAGRIIMQGLGRF